MELEILFDGIKERVLTSLNSASIHIWVAVAWITDKDYLDMLKNKKDSGVDVRLVLMNDEFNRSNQSSIDFLTKDESLFYSNSHHKYCIVDDELLITGSFNWTKSANRRVLGENIIITVNKESIARTKENFRYLTSREIYDPPGFVDHCIEKAKELGYNESVNEEIINWWVSLNSIWKLDLLREVVEDFKDDEKFERAMALGFNYLYIDEKDIKKIETYALNEFLILILNIVHFKNEIIVDNGSKNSDISPLTFLKKLKSIEKLSLDNFMQLVTLKASNKNLAIKNLTIFEDLDPKVITADIFYQSKSLNLRLLYFEETFIKILPHNLVEFELHLNSKIKDAHLSLSILNYLNDLKSLVLSGFIINFELNKIEKTFVNQLEIVRLSYCEIDVYLSKNIFEFYPNLYIEQSCLFLPFFADYQMEFNDKTYRYINNSNKQIIGDSDFKYFDENGKRYKLDLTNEQFIDMNGNTKSSMMRNLNGDFVFPDGDIHPF